MYFPSFFHETLKNAGIDCPESLDLEGNKTINDMCPFEKYPHAFIFFTLHVGQVIDLDSLEHNAEIIKGIPTDQLSSISVKDLFKQGVVMGNPHYLI
jgi:hypothetical protein